MDIPVMPTYHPAYIIRNHSRERELKGQVWEDIKKIMKHLGLEVKKND
jgi:DNA polymerase